MNSLSKSYKETKSISYNELGQIVIFNRIKVSQPVNRPEYKHRRYKVKAIAPKPPLDPAILEMGEDD